MAIFQSKQYFNMQFSLEWVIQYRISSPPVGLIHITVLDGVNDNYVVFLRAFCPFSLNRKFEEKLKYTIISKFWSTYKKKNFRSLENQP